MNMHCKPMRDLNGLGEFLSEWPQYYLDFMVK